MRIKASQLQVRESTLGDGELQAVFSRKLCDYKDEHAASQQKRNTASAELRNKQPRP